MLSKEFGKHRLSEQLDSRKASVDDRRGNDQIDDLKDNPKNIENENLKHDDRQRA